jgi:cytidylate kinase
MTPSKVFIVAIDGFSSCGKSTLAKQLARYFGWVYVDTGAMYRATTLYLIRQQISIDNVEEVEKALENIHISFKNIDGVNTTFLNDQNVESEIRSLEVSSHVSETAAIPQVRKKMVDIQKKMASPPGLVMDGRDIGTVVFPQAQLKIFLTADPDIRSQRRFEELQNQDKKQATLEEIKKNILHRDTIDTQRKDSPLTQSADAILIDNSHLSIEEQFDVACTLVTEKMKECGSDNPG